MTSVLNISDYVYIVWEKAKENSCLCFVMLGLHKGNKGGQNVILKHFWVLEKSKLERTLFSRFKEMKK